MRSPRLVPVEPFRQLDQHTRRIREERDPQLNAVDLTVRQGDLDPTCFEGGAKGLQVVDLEADIEMTWGRPDRAEDVRLVLRPS